MNVFLGILIFIYGLVFGSFYNVVGYRIPKKLSLLRPGSYCPNCRHKLRWYELIPLFSYVIQRGRCTQCKKKISFYYPLIEFLTGCFCSPRAGVGRAGAGASRTDSPFFICRCGYFSVSLQFGFLCVIMYNNL